MASIAHCLYAFEALAAHLEKRERLTLAQVQESYPEYLKAVGAEGADEGKNGSSAKQLPALRRLAAASSSSGSASPSSTASTTSLPQSGSGAETPNTSVSSLPDVSESPLFITWNIQSERYGYTLRGCIGTFEPLELEEGLSSYAMTAALQDTRFDPISLEELPLLEVAVTLLTDFEDAADAMDWEIGTHGLRLSFHTHGRRYGSTYLPDVAPEQGWTKEETVVSLMRKAGWMGRKDKWREVDLKVVRYQGKRESLEYDDYKQWKSWFDSK